MYLKNTFLLRLIVTNFSQQLWKGESLLIVGESGIGKSSLLRCCAGLWSDGCGEVQLCPRRSVARVMSQREGRGGDDFRWKNDENCGVCMSLSSKIWWNTVFFHAKIVWEVYGGVLSHGGSPSIIHWNRIYHRSGWWFGTCCFFPYIGNVIIPTDFHSIIFQRGRSTTNQLQMGFSMN